MQTVGTKLSSCPIQFLRDLSGFGNQLLVTQFHILMTQNYLENSAEQGVLVEVR
jgi:hypothetical protein